jgi:beta-glucanase (GH16 family)
MSTHGHSPEGKIAKRSFPLLKNRNIVRGASFVFVSTLAIGYSLVPAPAFASKAKLSIQHSKSNDVIYVKGANFPEQSTATVQTDVGGAKEERKVLTHNGNFKLSFTRHSADKEDFVRAKAWARNKSASAKKAIAPAKDAASVEAFTPTTEAPTTTTTAAPAGEAAPTTSTTIKSSVVKNTPTTAAATAVSSGGAPAGYKLAWSDEFNGSGMDLGKWGVYEGAGNAGIGKRVTSAVSQLAGELKITGNGMNGGGLATDYKSTYGYYEVRSRFDANSTGYNTAALLWPTSENWPSDGEIDLAEIFNGDTSNCGSYVHWGSGNSQLYNEYKGDFSQWHTWAVDWQPDHLTYYLDGKQIWNVTNAAAIPHNPHFLGLQLDVNSNGNKADGSAFHIDYVRVYQKG